MRAARFVLAVRPSGSPIVENETAMKATSLSVVMPVFNEARHLPATLDALTAALEGSGFEADLIVVDDGSRDGSGETARTAADGRVPVRVLRQANSGRFAARRRGGRDR